MLCIIFIHGLVVMFLEQGVNDLHMVQLMSLLPHHYIKSGVYLL